MEQFSYIVDRFSKRSDYEPYPPGHLQSYSDAGIRLEIRLAEAIRDDGRPRPDGERLREEADIRLLALGDEWEARAVLRQAGVFLGLLSAVRELPEAARAGNEEGRAAVERVLDQLDKWIAVI
ncbi:hypothetical protein ACELLULO517_15625 [Acidisoma cellulosilytica]|uniref:Uncharacterized protein n=1 Tax=Acidisoma cellulosilyticum TaxID=2802395 RepID=A0A963Z2J6_9PROT|nr:hypothetical protein [Acidisoma cellulosilyticum]MCB8881677.1 hypothetical protein [Acidisoma cellulosilyticum]